MQNRNPKYSILIPTRNGVRYLPYAIDSVLSQASDEFELIVSDNHSSDGTAEYLSKLSDPRLKVIKPETELPMTLHFEFILSHASGEWVTAIGDDDGLMPFFFDYLRSLRLDYIKAPAISFRRAFYTWPGCDGDAAVSYSPSPKKYYINSKLSLFLRICSISTYFDMPQLYTSGLIRNSFVKRIKEQSGGRFFHATAPDAASAVILALNSTHYYRVEQPLFWTGTSTKSIGYSQTSSVLKARAEDFDRLNSAHGLNYSARITAKIHKIFGPFSAVVLYDALLSCPSLSRFWVSKTLQHFFIAGLIVKRPELKEAILEEYADETNAAKIIPFIALVRLIKWGHGCLKVVLKGLKKRSSFVSKDRQRFSTLRKASDAISPLEKIS